MKNTEKLRKARLTANNIKLDYSVDEEFYSLLADAGYFWESKTQSWDKAPSPEEPTKLLNLRVISDITKVQSDVNRLVKYMCSFGYELVERSDIYLCRPPKQLEGRIYLKFNRSWEKEND